MSAHRRPGVLRKPCMFIGYGYSKIRQKESHFPMRVNPSLGGELSRAGGFPERGARCSLSLRERVRVRGDGANHPLSYRTIPGTVELGESSGRAGAFPK